MRHAASGGHLSSVKKALFLSVVAIVAFGSAEIVARLYLPHPLLPYIASANARLIYELNPRFPEFNSMGMRQGEITPAMLNDHFVVAVIGDSHTFGLRSLKRELAFPARLEYHLASLTGKRIAVLNFGVPGYNMAQELEVLRAKALPLKPDLIVLQYCINDEHISNYIQPKYPRLNRALHASAFLTTGWQQIVYSPSTQRTLLPFVERYSPDLLLYSPGLVGTPITHELNGAHGYPHPPRGRDQVPPRYWDVIGRENLERNVHVFGDVSRSAGIPTLATGFIEDGDKALYESSGFETYSFFDIFWGADMREYGYDPASTGGHFTDAGSDVIAKSLAGFIRTHFDLAIRAAQVH